MKLSAISIRNSGMKLDVPIRCALALYRVEIHNRHARILGMGNHPDADDSRRVDVHRFVWRFYNPDHDVPAGKLIHHQNDDPLDNRIENLAEITRADHRRIHGSIEHERYAKRVADRRERKVVDKIVADYIKCFSEQDVESICDIFSRSE